MITSIAKFKSVGLWGLASERLEQFAKRQKKKKKEDVNFHDICAKSLGSNKVFPHRKKPQPEPSICPPL